MPDSDVLSASLSDSGSDRSTLRETGKIPFARWCPSPNFGPRPDGAAISLLVVHNISLPPGRFGGPEIENFFCNCLDHSAHPYFRTIEGIQVSAHLLIRRDGAVVQFVSLLDRAWHAGRSSFDGQEECNDFSIGIELEGADDVPYTSGQYHQLARVADLIMLAWPDITAGRIAGHSDIAPGRKSDPGPAFDWQHFRATLKQIRAARESV
ncbi:MULTISPECIES: 1,6-anhydro-N-acetylmuramyl-L-alanine amidase AmpD [Marinobacter]|uniref:1,6-anhydro-N-acetylmuramyl-L-alanine amidase AmpD n=1 Tax=Marinobacter metalliresistant TaxID=2961995 RepID=A0ABZ2W264_9GAMM|nr:1,6-anhydro-N-acetylmuramyl-L-alanine amidase AmpD [Marinobacter sp. Arc7-DN-1]AXS85088.1 1,6-anhydro-N-acetylmuramyl-L-alanine amidase AmpD [Marinobacter sp. Arc7-DN-1]